MIHIIQIHGDASNLSQATRYIIMINVLNDIFYIFVDEPCYAFCTIYYEQNFVYPLGYNLAIQFVSYDSSTQYIQVISSLNFTSNL